MNAAERLLVAALGEVLGELDWELLGRASCDGDGTPFFDAALRGRVLDTGLVLEDVTLGFKAARPFYVRYALRRALGLLVNSSRVTQEWYEAGWTGWFPCYELDFMVRRR